MSNPVISVQNISKVYRLGEVGTGSLAHDINRLCHKLIGKEDPYLKVTNENRRDQRPGDGKDSEPTWVNALSGISFSVAPGEILGIVGRNGAGKSTLLKILSRITSQTSGNINIRGRMASLLEVGTGFHPELTGRENIFLNGAILGMRRREIAARFDEIVDFSGCATYIDTPVKRYSSGMYVRLAFAVAAHLNPEILIVDEVLAVGDAEFQRKCLGKMRTVSKEGRTVLFVSHNLSLISSLCSRAILLRNGKLTQDGNPASVIQSYISGSRNSSTQTGFIGTFKDNYAYIHRTYVKQEESIGNYFQTHLATTIGIELELQSEFEGLIVQFRLFANDERRLIVSNFDDASPSQPVPLKKGKYRFETHIPKDTLAKGNYSIAFWVGIHNRHLIAESFGECNFTMENPSGIGRWYYASGEVENVLRPRLDWSVFPLEPEAV
jgi:lipopolysaccharide transport system ATP-binding protein